jgi:hypothetical protein
VLALGVSVNSPKSTAYLFGILFAVLMAGSASFQPARFLAYTG